MARSKKNLDIDLDYSKVRYDDTESTGRVDPVDIDGSKSQGTSNAVVITDTTAPKKAPARSNPKKGREVVGKSKVRKQSILGTIIIASILAVMLVMMVQGRVEISETSVKISELKSKLSSLEKEKNNLNSKIEATVDMIAVEDYINNSGMVKDSDTDQVHVSSVGNEDVTVYETEDELMDGVFGTILSAISESFVRTWNTISKGE